MELDDILVILLAGGAGERLFPLTKDRAKPAVYFGGPYRIIDFTLSNCINSGLRRIFIATQYKSLSLSRHVRLGWSVVSEELGEFIEILPPQKRVGEHWYLGTADAVYQNLYSVERENPRHVIVLSGDHVYKMDYAKMLRFHIEKDAAATLKQVIDANGAAPNQATKPMTLTVTVSKIIDAAKSVAKPDAKPMLDTVSSVLANAGGKDHAIVSSQVVDNGTQFRVEVEQGVIQAIATASMMQAMGGGQATAPPVSAGQ